MSGWSTLWLVPLDVDGLSGALGGRAAFNAKLDQFFGTQKLRDYARPYYGEMSSCSGSGTGGATSTQCTFDDGHDVLLFEVPSGVSLETWRTTLGSTEQLQGATKTTWAKGAKWTLEKSGGAALYWDDEAQRVGGLALKSTESVSEIDSWWSKRFGKG